MPRLTSHYLGGFIDGKLIGTMTLGWGTRPHHTIAKLFPTLSTKDYLEIGKYAMEEYMPKNTESAFISKVVEWIKKNRKDIKILYSWADATLGKTGKIYQASNFLYGGFIWTDLYITNKGEKVHPRTSQGLTDKGDKKCGHRPTKEFLIENSWNHYKGKQFRYLMFLCNKSEQRKLLKESTESWGRVYPKTVDLEWKIQNLEDGDWHQVDSIAYDKEASNLTNKTSLKNKDRLDDMNKSKEFFNFD
jgi:hypothetical protein